MDKGQVEAHNQHLAFLMLETILNQDSKSIHSKAQQWDLEVIIDDIDYGVMKLVPLYFQKLKGIEFSSRYQKRLKVLHKYWWLKTLKNLDRLQEVIDALALNDKEVMLIKGVPILPFYESAVYRPMADLDILVKKDAVLASIAVLKKLGWKATDSSFLDNLLQNPNLCMDFRHSIELEHPAEKTKMDLHWKVGNYASWELTSQVWEKAHQSTEYPTAKIPSLDQVLCMAILHSVDSESKNHYNWIVDVALLNPHLSAEDWDKARALAIHERKLKWFDYGCFLLNRFGVSTPFAFQVSQAPLGRLRKNEFGSKVNLPVYIWKKIQNNLIILSINFPHDKGLRRILLLFRRIAYFGLNRAG